MNVGNGMIQVQSNTQVPGGSPPFPANTAYNGVSVDPVTGQIVLGDDLPGALMPASFVSDRNLNLDGFRLSVNNVAAPMLYIDPPTRQVLVGDVNGTFGGGQLILDATNMISWLTSDPFGTLASLRLQQLLQLSELGDVSSPNGVKLLVDAANNIIEADALEFAVFTPGFGFSLQLSNGSSTYAMGDINTGLNGTRIVVDDVNAKFSAIAGGSLMMELDRTADAYSIGDVNGTAGQMTLFVVGGAMIAGIGDVGGNCRVLADLGNNTGIVVATNGLSIVSTDGILLHHTAALNNGAGALVGTLNNSPVAGNPTKWIPIDDAGVQRFIPAW